MRLLLCLAAAPAIWAIDLAARFLHRVRPDLFDNRAFPRAVQGVLLRADAVELFALDPDLPASASGGFHGWPCRAVLRLDRPAACRRVARGLLKANRHDLGSLKGMTPRFGARIHAAGRCVDLVFCHWFSQVELIGPQGARAYYPIDAKAQDLFTDLFRRARIPRPAA